MSIIQRGKQKLNLKMKNRQMQITEEKIKTREGKLTEAQKNLVNAFKKATPDQQKLIIQRLQDIKKKV